MSHRPSSGGSLTAEVVPVPIEGSVDEVSAAQDDPITEVPDLTPQGLSPRQGAAGVEDGLDGFGGEAGSVVLAELLAADEELLAVETGGFFPVGSVVEMLAELHDAFAGGL